MTPDSRRSSHKTLPARPFHVPEESTLRELRTGSPVKRLMPWMGFILFCTGAVFHAGRIVERLDSQPQPALLSGLLGADVARSAPGTASVTPAPHEQPPEKQRTEAEALGKLMAERDQAQENARGAWQKQVEAEVAARIARMGEESSLQKQLEADELAQTALQAAVEAESKARELEIQLATKTAELQEARLREQSPAPEATTPADSKPTTLLQGAPRRGAALPRLGA
jgi:hypothetical protein